LITKMEDERLVIRQNLKEAMKSKSCCFSWTNFVRKKQPWEVYMDEKIENILIATRYPENIN
jgi:hypothetical protein